jgi:hypothetical protein
MSIDIEAVVAQYGAYYQPQGQSLATLKKLLYATAQTSLLFLNRPQESDYFRSVAAKTSSVMQAFQKAFTTKGVTKFDPNEFPLFHMKIDYGVYPDDFAGSYLGFIDPLDELARAAWPFIRWVIEQHILSAKEEDYELYMAFTGTRTTPTPGTAGLAINSMDGIRKIIRGYNTAGRLYLGNGPLAMGDIAEDPKDFCVQLEEWIEKMNPTFRRTIKEVCMSETLDSRYKRGKRALYGTNVNYLSGTTPADRSTIEDYPSIRTVGLLSHEGSDMIWASPAMNRIRPLKKSKLANVFKVEEAKREVAIMTDWYESLNFEIPEWVVTNEHDLA